MTAGHDGPLACARVRVLLESYVDGDLQGAGRADVRAHIASCSDCRRQHQQATSIPFRLRALSAPPARGSLVSDVSRAIALEHDAVRRSWSLLLPEGLLTAFILWYLSGLDGLGSIASGVLADLQSLIAGSLPDEPPVDVFLLVALVGLTAIAAYHLSILIRLAPAALPSPRAAHD